MTITSSEPEPSRLTRRETVTVRNGRHPRSRMTAVLIRREQSAYSAFLNIMSGQFWQISAPGKG